MHGERTLYESRWCSLGLVDVEVPDGPRFEHHVLRTPGGAVGTVVQGGDDSVLLLYRHRVLTGRWGWEIPAGAVDPGEASVEAASRETLEETGWLARAARAAVRLRPAERYLRPAGRALPRGGSDPSGRAGRRRGVFAGRVAAAGAGAQPRPRRPGARRHDLGGPALVADVHPCRLPPGPARAPSAGGRPPGDALATGRGRSGLLVERVPVAARRGAPDTTGAGRGRRPSSTRTAGSGPSRPPTLRAVAATRGADPGTRTCRTRSSSRPTAGSWTAATGWRRPGWPGRSASQPCSSRRTRIPDWVDAQSAAAPTALP